MDFLTQPDILLSFLTLCVLEIVLGIDNIIFISILTGKLPPDKQKGARQLGLALALVMRFVLLFSITWIMKLTGDLFSVAGKDISGKDLILFVGGAFLIWKSVKEIHEKVETHEESELRDINKKSFPAIIAQIVMLDLVFSIDSVITAVGMVDDIRIMFAAVIVAMAVMFMASGAISSFVNRHPAIKILALAFLMVIGVALVADSLDYHVPKGYIYSSLAFALLVEMINIRVGARKKKEG